MYNKRSLFLIKKGLRMRKSTHQEDVLVAVGRSDGVKIAKF